MSAFQKVMDCQDLRRYIREYLPPHPIAVIIEEEYLLLFSRNRRGDVRDICDATRMKLIEKGGYDAETKIFSFSRYEDTCWFSFQREAPTENYACLKYWAFNGLVSSIKFLNYLQYNLNLEDVSFTSIFQFKTDIDDFTYMRKKIFERNCLIKNCPSIMRDYYKIYDIIDDECYVDDKVYQVRFELDDGDIHFVNNDDGEFEFETIEEAIEVFNNYEKENNEVVNLTLTPYLTEEDYERFGLTYEIKYLMTK